MVNDKQKASQEYDASKITVLQQLEAVRKRPAMYIGDTNIYGLHHLVNEIVDNAIDEALSGFCDKIEITLHDDGSVSVRDNGRGMPVDMHKSGKPALEILLTTLHSGGKFDSETYKVAGGLHGVGLAVTNALSEWIEIEIYKNNKTYNQRFEKGEKKTELKITNKEQDTGSVIRFKPDSKIFTETTKFDLKTLITRFKQQSFLTGGLTFIVKDQRDDKDRVEKFDKNFPREFKFYFEGGIKSYVKHLNHGEKVVNESIFYTKKEVDHIIVELALQYTEDLQENVKAFANNIINPEGGTHLTGFRTALTKSLNDYLKKVTSEKENDIKLTGDDTREGLTAIISVKVPNPQFEGQTKIKLNNPEVIPAVRQVLEEELKMFLEEHPKDAKNIIQRAILTSKARKAAKAARESIIRKSALEGGTLPGKLADCAIKDSEKSELYVVEGDSAGGSAKQGRDRLTQAVLPLRGKPINAEKSRIDKVLQNEKLKDLIIALGCGVGESLDLTKLRYKKIILMNDADVDGEHITTLILTFFFRHLKPLIEKGYLYVAQPPLYKLEVGKDEVYWVTTYEERKKLVSELKTKGKEPHILRFKGLGEMNPEQLWETTMDPSRRTLKLITIEDAEEANRTFDVLMGQEVPPRKKFIQAYATQAELDV